MSKVLPPTANGIAELSTTKRKAIKTKFEAIKKKPKLVDEEMGEQEWSTHWLVAQYNWDNPDNPINGDTMEDIMNEVVK